MCCKQPEITLLAAGLGNTAWCNPQSCWQTTVSKVSTQDCVCALCSRWKKTCPPSRRGASSVNFRTLRRQRQREKVMFLKTVLCHWATGWNTLNRKSVVASAVWPHFSLFVSVCRGKREREGASEQEDKGSRSVRSWACLSIYCAKEWKKRATASYDSISLLGAKANLSSSSTYWKPFMLSAALIPPSGLCFTSLLCDNTSKRVKWAEKVQHIPHEISLFKSCRTLDQLDLA